MCSTPAQLKGNKDIVRDMAGPGPKDGSLQLSPQPMMISDEAPADSQLNVDGNESRFRMQKIKMQQQNITAKATSG